MSVANVIIRAPRYNIPPRSPGLFLVSIFKHEPDGPELLDHVSLINLIISSQRLIALAGIRI